MFVFHFIFLSIQLSCRCIVWNLRQLILFYIADFDHVGHDEAMEAGGREFDPRPGHYSRMSF